MSSPTPSTNLSPSIEELYVRVQRALNNAEADVSNRRAFEDRYLQELLSIVDRYRLEARYSQPLLLNFDPAPWKTQLDSLAALITSIRIALLARLLEVRQSTTFMPLIQALPVHGFFASRVNKRNAP